MGLGQPPSGLANAPIPPGGANTGPSAGLYAAIGLQALGGVSGAAGAASAGRMSQTYYDLQAHDAKLNADLATAVGERQAYDIGTKEAFEEGQLDRQVRSVEGSQKAALGANGMAGSVTAEDIARDTVDKKAHDEALIRFNAESAMGEARRRASMESFNYEEQGDFAKIGGANARAAGNMNASSTLLGSATQVASTWYFGTRGYGVRRSGAGSDADT